MTRLSIIVLCSVLSAAAGCSGDDDSDSGPVPFDQLFPADNELGSWAEDQSTGNLGVDLAYSDQEAVDLINGSADPFVKYGFASLGIEHYASGDATLELRIWEMDNASVAGALYTDLASDDAIYASQSWEVLDGLGQEARIADTGASLWVNVRSGAHIVESKINQVDEQARDDALVFVSVVLAKL